MDNQKLQMVLEQALPDATITVDGDGYRHQVLVVSDAFEGLSRVKRSQEVYRILNDYITSGELHALEIVTKTSEE